MNWKWVWRVGSLAVAMSLTGCMGMHGLMGGGCGGMMGGGHGVHQNHQPAPEIKAISCPVCGNSLTVSERTPRMTHVGTLYYFDTEEHLKQFIDDPDQFIKKKEDNQKGGGSHH